MYWKPCHYLFGDHYTTHLENFQTCHVRHVTQRLTEKMPASSSTRALPHHTWHQARTALGTSFPMDWLKGESSGNPGFHPPRGFLYTVPSTNSGTPCPVPHLVAWPVPTRFIVRLPDPGRWSMRPRGSSSQVYALNESIVPSPAQPRPLVAPTVKT